MEENELRNRILTETKKMRPGDFQKRCKGTIGFEIKDVQTTEATNPVNTTFWKYIYIE